MDRKDLLGQLRIDRDEPAPESSRRWLWAAIVAALVIAGGVTAYALGRSKPVVVEVASARVLATGPKAQAASVLDASGYVTARRQATVSAKITGKVRDIRIEEGQRVEEGQILATLDDVEARVQLDLANAQRAQAQAAVGEVRTQLANAEREQARLEGLIERKLVSESQLDTARTQAANLRARLASAQRSVEVAEESVRAAQVQLDNTIVRAPFGGVVTVKAAQPGEMISPISAGGGFTRTGIGTIVDMESLEVQVDVNESFIGRVQAGQPAETVLNAYPEWKIPGSVIAIIPTADRAKATVKVRVALAEKDARIVPDMGARVSFLEAAKPAAAANTPPPRPSILVPAAALRSEGGKSYVYVVRDGVATRREVTPGRTLGEEREIGAGLAVGERVVIGTPEGLADGVEVEIAGSTAGR